MKPRPKSAITPVTAPIAIPTVAPVDSPLLLEGLLSGGVGPLVALGAAVTTIVLRGGVPLGGNPVVVYWSAYVVAFWLATEVMFRTGPFMPFLSVSS